MSYDKLVEGKLSCSSHKPGLGLALFDGRR